MTKTAAFILNHNLPDYTDMVYEALKPFERNDYELFVMDNGSSPEGKSKYTTYASDVNGYFGGGFDAAMGITLEDDKYDSMLFVNNDLTIHPRRFVESLRRDMFWANGDIAYDIIAPTFYNIEPKGQCHWKTMHSYGCSFVREVPYVDFQCPLITKRLLKEAKEIDSDLTYGWGICFWFALLCEQRGWKLGVSDRNCVLHHNSLTVKKGVSGLDIATYCRLAEEGQMRFFKKNNLMDGYMELRKKAELYDYSS